MITDKQINKAIRGMTLQNSLALGELEEALKVSGELIITYTPGAYNISTPTASSTHGDFVECIRNLRIPTRQEASDRVEG